MTSNICKLCGKPIRYTESQANIPVYNEQGENIRIDKYHLNCSFKVDEENKEYLNA